MECVASTCSRHEPRAYRGDEMESQGSQQASRSRRIRRRATNESRERRNADPLFVVGVVTAVVLTLAFFLWSRTGDRDVNGNVTIDREATGKSTRNSAKGERRDYLAAMELTEVAVPERPTRAEEVLPPKPVVTERSVVTERPVVGYESDEPTVLNLPSEMPLSDTIELAAESSDMPALGPKEGNIASLRLSGSIGGVPLRADDPMTWSQIGYALQQRSRTPYFLIGSSGNVRTFRKAKEEMESLNRPSGPPGDPKFHLVVDARTSTGASLRFYGRSLGSNVKCVVSVTILSVGEKTEIVGQFSVTEEVSQIRGGVGPRRRAASGAQQAYYLAMEKAAKRLSGHAAFR